MAKTKPAVTKGSFEASLLALSYRFPITTVFDDFLTLSIAACTQNLHTKLSWYEDEYLATIEKYKELEVRHEFPKAFASLIMEMEERTGSSLGNDVLGDFFEIHVSNGHNGQYFTPYPICMFMASIAHTDAVVETETQSEQKRILDPTCGSGRMLLASRTRHGSDNEYYGIDIDLRCVKMTALNLFLNGVWHSEVMCADALRRNDFVIAYRISLFPLGIFKIEEREQSKLWHLYQNSFESKEPKSTNIILDSTPINERKKDNGTQLDLFNL
jgi:hypothetical protein